MSGCRFDVTVNDGAVAVHSGRTLYRVVCRHHGLLHPGSTSIHAWINRHLDDASVVWGAVLPQGPVIVRVTP